MRYLVAGTLLTGCAVYFAVSDMHTAAIATAVMAAYAFWKH